MISEVHSETSKKSKVEFSAKIVNWETINYFRKNLHLRWMAGFSMDPLITFSKVKT